MNKENIINLCKQVIDKSINIVDSSCDIDLPQCQFCNKCSLDTKQEVDIKHKENCAYLLALDILSNI